MMAKVKEVRVETPYGMVRPMVGEAEGHEVVFLPRHGAEHSVPPHRINYQANIWGMRTLGVEAIIATAAVGSLNPEMRPGDCVLIDQFIDFTKNRRQTFFEGRENGVFHLDFTEPYCPALRKTLAAAAGELRPRPGAEFTLHERGVYLCTEGPRFETPAEIKAYALLGADVVGMTNCPEVVLAREAGICYATIAMVTNLAAGMAGGQLTHEEVLEVMAKNTSTIWAILQKTLEKMAKVYATGACTCREAGRYFEKVFGHIFGKNQ
ncbi:MAG: S-methyl-5'-thioadenosine phosphorylase [Clostridia bacterium]|nr:S-methyl-5'-thioadenosine phosphorylase [Clostridia bacterium]